MIAVFRKPSLASLEQRELDEVRRTLLVAERERDFYIHSINYCTARIAALEARVKAQPPAEKASTFWEPNAIRAGGKV